MMNRESILNHVKALGATHCQFVDVELLVPEERIRGYCREDKCGRYQKHLSCPPSTGTVEETAKKLEGFRTGVLIQYSQNLDVKNDKEGLRRTKLKLHHLVLETEKYLKDNVSCEGVWGMIGGNCDLCDECAGYRDEPCEYPDEARASMEAYAINVVGLLKKLKLDSEFRDDRVTWTGIVLVDRKI